jgi:hypothetical protein
MKYASQTTVPVAKSKMEIEAMLSRYGADQFVSGWERAASADEAGRAVIGFRVHEKQVRFELPLPRKEAFASYKTRGGWTKKRTLDQTERNWEQAMRQHWRALALVVKAKLEAVETGITTFEQEFLAHIVVPGTGRTVGEWLGPQLDAAYIHGRPISLLPGSTE